MSISLTADLLCDTEAEDGVIAAVLVEPDACPKLAGVLEPKHFFREANAWAYEAAMAVWHRGEEPNQITVAHELAVRGRLDDAGGQTFLSDCIRNCPTTVGDSALWYAGIVRRLAMSREALSAAHTITRLVLDNPSDVERAISRGVDLLQGIAGQVTTDDVQDAQQVFEGGLWEQVEAHMDNPGAIRGVRTGIAGFDEAIDGLVRGRVYLYGAETSMGKSLFVQDVTRRLVLAGHRVLVFTTEMSASEFLQRMVFQQAGLDPWAHKTGYSHVEREQIRDAMDVLSRAPVTFCDRGDLSNMYLRGVVQREKAKHDVMLVVVDHIDQVSGAGPSRTAELEAITKGLKNIAKDQHVAVMEVSHVSRLTEYNNRSRSSRMRNSESKAQDADIGWMFEPIKQGVDGTWVAMDPDEAREKMSSGLHLSLSVFKQRHGRVTRHRLFLSWRTGGRFEGVADR